MKREWITISSLASPGDRSEFEKRLQQLIQRVEAWIYSDTEAGSGVPVEIADELAVLTRRAPSAGLRGSLHRAQDALDDGLSAEAVAGELYRVRAELERGQGSRRESPSR